MDKQAKTHRIILMTLRNVQKNNRARSIGVLERALGVGGGARARIGGWRLICARRSQV